MRDVVQGGRGAAGFCWPEAGCAASAVQIAARANKDGGDFLASSMVGSAA
jgi:hypothetical protein